MWSNESSSGSTGLFGALAVIVVIWAIFGGGLFGNRAAAAYDNCGCQGTSNCQVEKQTIINTATTQNLIQVEAEKTRDANSANTQRLYDQASRQYEAGLQEKIFDLKLDAHKDAIIRGQELAAKDAEIIALKQAAYLDRRFDAQAAQITALSCELPKRPAYFAQGFVCQGQPIPSGNGCF